MREPNILSESHYTPGEFIEALGSPSFISLLKCIKPMALVGLKAILKAKMVSHLPRLDRRFAKECGRGWFSKRCWEIQSLHIRKNGAIRRGKRRRKSISV